MSISHLQVTGTIAIITDRAMDTATMVEFLKHYVLDPSIT